MTNEADERPDERPDFGPGGYLPRRAAQRARKIILRERMGLGWPVAAVTAALVLAIVGLVFVLTTTTAPGPPFQALAPVEEVQPGSAMLIEPAQGPPLLVVRVGGVGVFEAPGEPVVYCPESRRLEAPGTVWNLRGRLVGGDGDSLRPVASRVHDGSLYVYVDPAPRAPAPPPAREGETPVCAAG